MPMCRSRCACWRAGRYDDAVVAYRQALEVGTFSSTEKAQILYLLGKTLEALGRVAEALEAYGWTRNEVPGFQDVAQRIKHLLAGGRGLLPGVDRPPGPWSETCSDWGSNSRLRC